MLFPNADDGNPRFSVCPPRSARSLLPPNADIAMFAGRAAQTRARRAASVIHGGMTICDLDVAPAFERSKHHEEIGGAIALVLVIETGRASRFHRDRHARFGNELL